MASFIVQASGKARRVAHRRSRTGFYMQTKHQSLLAYGPYDKFSTTHILHTSHASASPRDGPAAERPQPCTHRVGGAHSASHTPAALTRASGHINQCLGMCRMTSMVMRLRNHWPRQLTAVTGAPGAERAPCAGARARGAEAIFRPAVRWRRRRHPAARGRTTCPFLYSAHVNSKDQTYHNGGPPRNGRAL